MHEGVYCIPNGLFEIYNGRVWYTDFRVVANGNYFKLVLGKLESLLMRFW